MKRKSSQPSLLASNAHRPLPDLLRPSSFDEVVGQEHLTGPEGALTRMLAAQALTSIIFWGPPGCGKTTLARLLAEASGLHLEILSALTSGVGDLRKVFETAEKREADGQGTLLFVDEIHRFNRAQQDIFLPYVEHGTVMLIGATTENPSFELNGALLSRCKVLVLKRLDDAALERLIARAEEWAGRKLPLEPEARAALLGMADGDGRYLLSLCAELLTLPPETLLDTARLCAVVQKRAPLYDKQQESHYNLISALHKSLRGSDADAALYWLCRMLDGGESPLYICRRLVRFAVEDVGMADPEAVHQALAAKETYDFLGSPEGELAIAQAVIYLATAPKSNAAYIAYGSAMRDARQTGSLMPPMHILNAPTKMMKELGYSKGYAYDHDAEDGFSGQNYFPGDLPRRDYYRPVERGFERDIKKRLEYFAKLRERRKEEGEA